MHLDPRELAERLRLLRENPGSTAVCTDFDGTLSEVVADPDLARPLPGVPELLRELDARFRVVAVISGRPLSFLDAHLPGTYLRSGLYGLEESSGGERREHPEARRWRSVVEDVVTAAQQSAPPGTRVEAKGLSLTLHYREHPEIRDELDAWVAAHATQSGLEVRPARRSFELHPPLRVDKGTVLRRVAAGCRQVCFLGDDVGDVPAFEALDSLAAEGVTTLKVAVSGGETDPAVLAAADLVVEGPPGALALLRGFS